MFNLIFWLDMIVLAVFFCVIALIMLDKNRAFVALIGAVIVVTILSIWSFFIPSLQQIHVSEFISDKIEILSLVLGLMLIVEILLETGIFEFIALKMIRLTKGSPFPLFLVFIL
ncbi:MAG: SLC13 family permease, partial [Candidatus Helarchaeales archaeon]